MKTEIDPERSRIMRSVKSFDTGPELIVRRLVFGMGYRYRLHSAALPGKPDLVFATRRKLIFVHGCFWHGHSCARGNRVPSTNADYWREKIARNELRDERNISALKANGWGILVIWECELKDLMRVRKSLSRFLH